MKFIDLKKSDTQRNETYTDFEEELNKFRLKYDETHKFDLNYYNSDELIIIINDMGEYNENIHYDLCQTFDVKLRYVEKRIVQTVKGQKTEIALSYSPVHHYIKYLEYDEINIK